MKLNKPYYLRLRPIQHCTHAVTSEPLLLDQTKVQSACVGVVGRMGFRRGLLPRGNRRKAGFPGTLPPQSGAGTNKVFFNSWIFNGWKSSTGLRSNIFSLHYTSSSSSFLQLLDIQWLAFIDGIKKQHVQPSSRRKLLEKTNSASR